MEQRFEHKRRACYYTEIPDVLQKMEIDGWELVSTSIDAFGSCTLIFKRPIVPKYQVKIEFVDVFGNDSPLKDHLESMLNDEWKLIAYGGKPNAYVHYLIWQKEI